METKIIGRSVGGRELKAWFWGSGRVRVLINGGHHGNEWITSRVLDKYISQLAENGAKSVGLEKLEGTLRLCIVPQVNPDGIAIATNSASGKEMEQAEAISRKYPHIPFPSGWKANLNGVDLNLNYPAGWSNGVLNKADLGVSGAALRDWPGPAPLSEPETRAMAALTRVFDPCMTISLHTQGREIYWNYGDMEPRHSRHIAEAMALSSGYAALRTPPEAGYGGYKDWFIERWSRPGFTVELGLGENPLPFCDFAEVYEDCRKIIAAGIAEYLKLC